MVKNNGLLAFIRFKVAEMSGTDPDIDWEARKRRWLHATGNLYRRIRRWLAPLEKDGILRFSKSSVALTEDLIGSYEIGVLEFSVGKQRVGFYPKGTLIVGARGRVDVRGNHGTRSIVLRGNQWFFVERVPELKIVPFNRKAFKNLLQEVMV